MGWPYDVVVVVATGSAHQHGDSDSVSSSLAFEGGEEGVAVGQKEAGAVSEEPLACEMCKMVVVVVV